MKPFGLISYHYIKREFSFYYSSAIHFVFQILKLIYHSSLFTTCGTSVNYVKSDTKSNTSQN